MLFVLCVETHFFKVSQCVFILDFIKFRITIELLNSNYTVLQPQHIEQKCRVDEKLNNFTFFNLTIRKDRMHMRE